MRHTSLAIVVGLAAIVPNHAVCQEVEQPAAHKPQARAVETAWVPLFDGVTLDGWTQRNGTATYRVEDGVIVGRTKPGSPNSFLCTNRDYSDFELKFDVKVDSAYRGWLPQQYDSADIDVASFYTWSVGVKARFFKHLALHRAYYAH